MARLWSGGAETQATVAAVEYSAIISTAPAIETTTKRSGNAAWRISNAAAIEGFRQIHTAAQGEFFFRFYLYIVAMPTSATKIIGGSRQTGANKAVIRLTSGGALQLYNAEDSAQVGSNSSALSTATWYRIELAYDSTTLASTTTSARIDGVEFASGTIDITATPNSFGCFTEASDATLDYIVDDLAINDASGSFETSWPGEGEIIHLYPNAAGDNADWTRGGTDSGANWSQCDEFPPDDASTYVYNNALNATDDYNLDATPAALESTDTINCVQVGIRAAVADATSADPDIVLRIKATAAGTVEESVSLDCNSLTPKSPAPLPANDNYALTLYDLPGASTTAWTKADLDTAQVGVRISTADTNAAIVSTMWVLVDHKPAAGGGDTPIVADTVSFALTGNAATLSRQVSLTADAGAFALSGQAAGLTVGYQLTAAQATFALTGQDATLSRQVTITADVGAYTLAGVDVSLEYSGAGGAYSIDAATGTFALTGQDAALLVGYQLTAAVGAYTFTGQDAPLYHGYTVAAGIGAFTLTGQDAGLSRAVTLAADTGAYTLTGNAANFLLTYILAAGVGSYSLTGQDVTLTISQPSAYYLPGTRDIRRARGRGELLSDAPGRARARVREPIDAEG